VPRDPADDILHDADLIRRELQRVQIANGAYVLMRDTSHMIAWLDHIERCAHQLLRGKEDDVLAARIEAAGKALASTAEDAPR